MNAELEQLLKSKLSQNQPSPQQPQPTLQNQIASLYQQIQEKGIAEKLEKNINQIVNGTESKSDTLIDDQYEAGQGLKQMFSKDKLITAVGVANAAAVSSALPISLGSLGFGIAGMSKIIVGVAAKKFIAKSGMIGSFFDGVLLSGISDAVGGFISLGSLGLGNRPAAGSAAGNFAE